MSGVAAELEDRLKALMIRGQAGDAAAWRELLSVLSRQLRSYFGRRLDTAADVEDLVQETLIAVHTRRATYDPGQPFTAWAYAVARYKLIDHWRRTKVRKHVPIDDVSDWLAEEGASAEDGAVRADLDKVLSVLPERQRTLVRDVKIEGLSLAEAGARMGVSEGAAKVALHRAMKLLTLGARKT